MWGQWVNGRECWSLHQLGDHGYVVHLIHKLPDFRSWFLNCSRQSGIIPPARGAATHVRKNANFEMEFG
jgi:hypothetical protein